jgi:quercetin dioxygenase-like cupin family protein
MSEDEFRAQIAAEGYPEVRAISYEPNQSPELHTHEFDAKGIVLGGALTIVLDAGPTTFAVGEVYEVPAGTRHAEHTGDVPTSVIVGVRPV